MSKQTEKTAAKRALFEAQLDPDKPVCGAAQTYHDYGMSHHEIKSMAPKGLTCQLPDGHGSTWLGARYAPSHWHAAKARIGTVFIWESL